MLKIFIENDEQLALKSKKDVKREWKADFDELIVPEIEPTIPCFILYRLDTKATDYPGYEWMLISFIPETGN
jgi:twinfilin